MPIFSIANTLLRRSKWLLRAAEEAVPLGLAWLTTDLADNAEATGDFEWRRFVYEVTRTTPSGTTEDRAQFKLDLINITSGDIDNTWTTGDLTTCHNALFALGTALKPYTAPTHSFDRIKAYRMRFNPVPDLKRPFADSGPPVWNAQSAQVGTGTGVLPYQVAATVTLRTAWPKHWGRIYLPGPHATAIDTTGRFTSTYRGGVNGAVDACLDTLAAADFFPVVPVGQLDKDPFHALLGVELNVTDDVPDVQRRRRPRSVAARSVSS